MLTGWQILSAYTKRKNPKVSIYENSAEKSNSTAQWYKSITSVPNKVRVYFMRFYPGAVYVRVVATLALRK